MIALPFTCKISHLNSTEHGLYFRLLFVFNSPTQVNNHVLNHVLVPFLHYANTYIISGWFYSRTQV